MARVYELLTDNDGNSNGNNNGNDNTGDSNGKQNGVNNGGSSNGNGNGISNNGDENGSSNGIRLVKILCNNWDRESFQTTNAITYVYSFTNNLIHIINIHRW